MLTVFLTQKKTSPERVILLLFLPAEVIFFAQEINITLSKLRWLFEKDLFG